MGRKTKSFIDKKKAVTYNLVYRSTEDADAAPERLLVEAEKGVGLGRPDVEAAAEQHAAHVASGRRFPPGHPLAWLEEEARPGPELSDARRRELLQLGFPDDGYDYLRHMRTIGRGAGSLETGAGGGGGGAVAAGAQEAEDGFAGPSFFVPAAEVEAPEEDVRLIDASGLTVMQPVEREEEAEGLMGGVTAFSRQRKAARGAVQRELEEVEALMRQLEEEDGEGEEGAEGGVGDLLDDFVVTATEVGATFDGAGAAGGTREEGGTESDLESYGSSGEEEYEEYEESGSAYSADAEGAGAAGDRAPARPGSIASTYWREERRDRKELLAVVDERFEQLAFEYDEDEIGEMEEQEGEIRGHAALGDFQGILDEFRASHTQSQRAYEDNVPYLAPGYKSAISTQLEKAGMSDEDGAVAIQKAHEALRRAEEAERSGDAGERALVWVEDGGGAGARERWDCESVLSLRSNLDNHPGRIREPGRGPRGGGGTAGQAVGQGMIRLGRHGIPMGVLPGKPTAAALRKLDSTAGQAAAAGGAGGGASEEEGDGPVGQGAAAAAGGRRDKGESAEEKKARKAAVKEAKREARATKKELKEMFRQESAKAQRRAAGSQVQAALRLA